MVRDDLEACLQAYSFAAMFLSGLEQKTEKEREEALTAARRLREEVEPRYVAARANPRYEAAQLASLAARKDALDAELAAATQKD